MRIRHYWIDREGWILAKLTCFSSEYLCPSSNETRTSCLYQVEDAPFQLQLMAIRSLEPIAGRLDMEKEDLRIHCGLYPRTCIILHE